MIRAKDKIWYFDQNAQAFPGEIESVLDDASFPRVNIKYEKKGKVYFGDNIPHKDTVEMVKFHPTRKEANGDASEWNVKINCYKPRG